MGVKCRLQYQLFTLMNVGDFVHHGCLDAYICICVYVHAHVLVCLCEGALVHRQTCLHIFICELNGDYNDEIIFKIKISTRSFFLLLFCNF